MELKIFKIIRLKFFKQPIRIRIKFFKQPIRSPVKSWFRVSSFMVFNDLGLRTKDWCMLV